MRSTQSSSTTSTRPDAPAWRDPARPRHRRRLGHPERTRPSLAGAPQLTGRPLAITFVTVDELTRWTLIRHWGPQRAAGLRRFFASVVVLPYSPKVATLWGEIQAHAQLRGRPRPINDTWIAACCLARRLPLATLNHKDFADFADHEGLELVR